MKTSQAKVLQLFLLAVVIVALITCALVFVYRGGRDRAIAAVSEEAASWEAYYNDVVARKKELSDIRKALETEESELGQQIVDAEKDTKARRDKVAEWEDYLRRESEASEEAWRLEEAIASLEALRSAEADDLP